MQEVTDSTGTVQSMGSSEPMIKKKESKAGFAWMIMFIIGFAIIFLIEHFVVKIDQVDGYSMVPTLQNNEYVLIDKLIYRLEKPQYGQIVAIQWGSNGIIKRVIGLPGDVIQIKDGSVFRNGHRLIEPYIKSTTKGEFGPITVPPGDVFLLGDNRNESRDSRSFGPVPYADIIGRADAVLWPLRDFAIQPLGKK